MGGSSAKKNAVFGFLHFGETPSSASEVSTGGRNYGGRKPPSFAGSTGFEGGVSFDVSQSTGISRGVSLLTCRAPCNLRIKEFHFL
jgi:hypothetical protein